MTKFAGVAALATTTALGLAGSAGAAVVGAAYTLSQDGTTLVYIGRLEDPTALTGRAIIGATLDEIALRPNTGELYGYSAAVDTFYVVDPATGVATPVAVSGAPIADSGAVGLDFNNRVDAERLVTTDNDNVVHDPKPDPDTVNTAAPVDLMYAAGDVNFGVDPEVFANAYTNAVAQPLNTFETVQYTLDARTDYLSTLNNNGGVLTSVGQLLLGGAVLDFSDVGGFDILSYAIGNNTGVALLTVGGVQGLYSFLPPTMAGDTELTFLGNVGTEFGLLKGFAVAPVPLPAAGLLLLAGLGGLAAAARRRRSA